MKIQGTIVFNKNWQAFLLGVYKYIINSGSSRSSKTFSIIQIFWILAWLKPNTKLAVFRNTKKDCKDTVMQDMLKYYSTLDNYNQVVFNKTESYFTFPNGSTINIEGTDDDLKVHGYHSDYLWFNEFYRMPKTTFDQLDMRCSGVVFMDYNPVGKLWSDDLIKQENAILIHSTFMDNPMCPPEQKNKIQSYQPVEMCYLVVEKMVTFQAATVYNCKQNLSEFQDRYIRELTRCQRNEYEKTADKYMWQVYGLGMKSEKPNRIFKGWTKITDREFEDMPYNNYYGLDFGSTNPSALIEVKYSDKCFYIRKRLYKPMSKMQPGDENNPGGLIKELELMKIKKSDIIVADSADKDNRIKISNSGYNIMPARKGPGSVEAGIAIMNEYKIYYVEDEEFEFEYENYEWEVVNGVNLDRPIKKDDHALDAARYIIHWMVIFGYCK